MGWSDWIRGAEIEPSLYAADFSRLGEQITELLGAGARIFHFDVGDGHFVPPVTIGPVVLRSIAPLVHERGGVLDCHLMVDDPVHHIPEIAASGGDSVTFHVEAVADPETVITIAREHDLGVGVAFNPETPVDVAADAARGADLALCMSIQPGYSGPGVHARGARSDRRPRSTRRLPRAGRRWHQARQRSRRLRRRRTPARRRLRDLRYEDLTRTYKRLDGLLR